MENEFPFLLEDEQFLRKNLTVWTSFWKVNWIRWHAQPHTHTLPAKCTALNQHTTHHSITPCIIIPTSYSCYLFVHRHLQHPSPAAAFVSMATAPSVLTLPEWIAQCVPTSSSYFSNTVLPMLPLLFLPMLPILQVTKCHDYWSVLCFWPWLISDYCQVRITTVAPYLHHRHELHAVCIPVLVLSSQVCIILSSMVSLALDILLWSLLILLSYLSFRSSPLGEVRIISSKYRLSTSTHHP